MEWEEFHAELQRLKSVSQRSDYGQVLLYKIPGFLKKISGTWAVGPM